MVRVVEVSSFLSESPAVRVRFLLGVPPVTEVLFRTPKRVVKGRFPPADADRQVDLIDLEVGVSYGPVVLDGTNFFVFFFFWHGIARTTTKEEPTEN